MSEKQDLFDDLAIYHYQVMAKRLLKILETPADLENELSLRRLKNRFPKADPATMAMVHAMTVATLKSVAQQTAVADYQTLLIKHPDPEAVEQALRAYLAEKSSSD